MAAPLAMAQGDNPPSGQTSGTGQASGDANATVTTPKVTPPTANATTTTAPSDAKKDDGITDHEKVVGKFGVGYLGLTQLPLAADTPPALTRTTLAAPVIGVRYWFSERMGIDGGLGFALFSSSSEVQPGTPGSATTQTDGPAGWGGALHGGLPIAFAYGKHYKFLLVPEVRVGITRRGEQPNNNQGEISHGGFRLDVGARVGTEIQFGFIGVPELALQASVGLGFRRQVWHHSQDSSPANPERSSSFGENSFGTSVQSDPWALFVNNISAIYYFP